MLVTICARYEKNPSRTLGVIDRAQHAWRTEGQTNGQTNEVQPIYPPPPTISWGYNAILFQCQSYLLKCTWICRMLMSVILPSLQCIICKKITAINRYADGAFFWWRIFLCTSTPPIATNVDHKCVFLSSQPEVVLGVPPNKYHTKQSSIVVCSETTHYLSQWSLLIYHTLRNMHQWNKHHNLYNLHCQHCA